MWLHGFEQIPQSEYRRRVEELSAWSPSRVCRAADDPRLVGVPVEQTDAMRLGTALHTLLLEPESYRARHPVAPKVDRRTNVGKAEWAAFLESCSPDAAPLDEDENTRVCRAAMAVAANRDADRLISSSVGFSEGSAFVRGLDLADLDGGERAVINASCRPDRITEDLALVQLKSARDGHDVRKFGYALRDLRYAVGEAWGAYVAGRAANVVIAEIAFVAVEIPTKPTDRGWCRVYRAQVDSPLVSASIEQAVAAIRRHRAYCEDPAAVTAELDATVDISEWSP